MKKILIVFLFSIILMIFCSIDNIKEKINDKKIEYDTSMLAFYVNGEKSENLDSNKKYDLVNYTCLNNEVVKWNKNQYSISVTPLNKELKCILYFEELEGVLVTFDSNGGDIPSVLSTKVNYDSAYGELPTVSRTGYRFNGWYTEPNGGTKITSSTIMTLEDAHVLYAQWTLITPITSYSCKNASSGSEPYVIKYTNNCSIYNDGSGNWRIKLLEDGTLTVTEPIIVDAFLVGGGGGGGSGTAGGGGGGRTNTVTSISLTPGQSYAIDIGAGGGAGVAGNTTYAFGYQATGGDAGDTTERKGGNGGSGGGGGGSSTAVGGAGGAYGNGGSNGAKGNGGSGQGKTTCEFGEGTLTACTKGTAYAYSGGGGGSGTGGTAAGGIGGGGAGGSSGSPGTANTGGGGGGGRSSGGGAGGSGVVVIRNTKYIMANNEIIGTYTSSTSGVTYQILNDGINWKIKFLASGTFVPAKTMVIDVFLVGGGAGGFAGPGGGGGGGKTETYTNITLNKDTSYVLTIGAGGAVGVTGNKTIGFGYEAAGGSIGNNSENKGGNVYRSGGAGGSGGGGGGDSSGDPGGAGGSYGNNGANSIGIGGTGQGTTTCEFGEGTLSGCTNGTGAAYGGGGAGSGDGYAAGGIGGGGSSTGNTGAAGTDGYGGGGGSGRTGGARGGSGTIIIRAS